MKYHLALVGRLARPLMVAFVFGLIVFLSLATLSLAGVPGTLPVPSVDQYSFPDNKVLIPLGDEQRSGGEPDALKRREAYKAVVESVYRYDDIAWSAANAGGFEAGTAIAPPSVSGNFDLTLNIGGISPDRAFGLHPLKIAVLYSDLRDEFDQTVTWEEGDFEQLFRVYLWGQHYFEAINETEIAAGDLSDYDLLIAPAIRIGWVDDVAGQLGNDGLVAIRVFVEDGGTFYAQADSAYLAEAAGLVPAGTVLLDTRLTDPDNTAQLAIDQPGHPLTFGWLQDSTYVLNQPVFSQTETTTLIAHFQDDTTQPGTPAILTARPGDGRVILMNGHPSDRQDTLPQVLDMLLWTMGQPAGIHGSLRQNYSTAVSTTLIPAFEAAPILITTTFRNYWDSNLNNIVVTEIVQDGFDVDPASVTNGGVMQTNADGTTSIVWTNNSLPPGDTHFNYIAYSQVYTHSSRHKLVSTAQADYVDPGDENRPYHMRRNDLWVSALMAARLSGDRDIELDGGYPLPAGGWFYDLALTLENKEESTAHQVVVTDVVALISPVVDVDDQNLLVHVVTDTTGSTEGDNLWAANEVFFYDTPVDIYPLPTINGAQATVGTTYTVASANSTYTITGPFTTTAGLSNSVTISSGLSGLVTLNPDGSLTLPALVLVWNFGDFQGYDHLDPAIRYGLFSYEFDGRRQVSFESDPMTDTGAVATGWGGSVWTNLGSHPIPYREYLQSGIVVVPTAAEQSRVDYLDIWQRDKSMPLRTVFYDIVPFPPPEYHAVVNTTFEMTDDDGQRLLEYPARQGADLRLYLKSHSNFAAPLDLSQEETLISQGMFHGLGFDLEPANDDWESSWSSPNLQGKPGATVLTTTVKAPGHTYLYFQQELDHQAYEGIYIDATLNSHQGSHYEGVMKIDDGARFVYHQKALGPSRYEVFDAHVQAVFGLSADAQVDKAVAPVRIDTYDDQVYHFVQIEDPWDPRNFGYDPYIKSYGFGDMAATVYVGGRRGSDLLYPRVAPGGQTQIRLEIRNNTDQDLENLVITPQAPAGIQVTERPTSTIKATDPIFFDFPFLHLDRIPNTWKTVYYYDVQVDAGFSQTGQTHEINFQVSADNLPADFRAPAALLGVGGQNEYINTVYGQATNLQLTDVIPPYVSILDARLTGSAGQINLMQGHLATGDEAAAQQEFELMPYELGVVTQSVESGTSLSFNLPAPAAEMPWLDNGRRNGQMWIVFKSQANTTRSGTNLINYGPEISYLDDFTQVYTDTGPDVSVEAHGAVVEVSYHTDSMTDKRGNTLTGIVMDEENRAELTVSAFNSGDYIAARTVITVELAQNAVVSSTSLPPKFQDENSIVFELGDIAPNATASVGLSLYFLPTSSGFGDMAPPDSWTVIERTDGQFINRRTDTLISGQLGGSHELAAGRKLARPVYLPLVWTRIEQQLDLVITDFRLNPPNPQAGQNVLVEITVENQGQGDAGAFWVDFYVDPDPAPTRANQVWYEICADHCIGIAWKVPSLAAGESIRLTSDANYSTEHTIWPGSLPGGTHNLFAYVDSWNPGVSYGAEAEINENNNRSDLMNVTITGQGGGIAASSVIDIPPRPAP